MIRYALELPRLIEAQVATKLYAQRFYNCLGIQPLLSVCAETRALALTRAGLVTLLPHNVNYQRRLTAKGLKFLPANDTIFVRNLDGTL
jgi:hypothetical protein